MEYAAVLSQTYNENAYREVVLQHITHTHSHPPFLGNIHIYWKMSPEWASFQLILKCMVHQLF